MAESTEHGFLEAILDGAAVLVAVTDRDGRILLTNRTLRERCGQTAADLHGRRFEEALGWEPERPAMARELRGLVAAGGSGSHDFHLPARDGTRRLISWAGTCVPDAHGDVQWVVVTGTDVTELRRTSQSLREADRRLHTIVDSITAGVAVIGQDMHVMSLNRQMAEWFPRVDPADHPTCFRVFNDPPRETPCSYCPVVQTLADGQVHEAITDTPTGEDVRHFRVVASPLHDGQGIVTGAVETVEDITERWRAEAALQTERDNLQAVFASSPVGMLLLDDRTVVTDANETVAVTVLREPAEIIGQRAGNGLGCAHSTEDERGCGFAEACADCQLRRALEGVLASGEAVHGAEIQPTLMAGGSELRPWLRVSVEPVQIGGRRHLIVAVDDISGRKQAEEDLRQVSLRQEAILATAATSVMVVDPDSIITDINDAFTETTGYTRAEVIGQPCMMLEGEPCQRGCRLFGAEAVERVVGAECSLRAKDGRRLVARKNAQVLRDQDGRVTGAIESFQDVTGLVHAREEALSASQSKSAFLAQMSHEIRTPLNGVVGMVALALDTDLSGEQREFLETASSSAQVLLGLINDVLDYSKIEAGRLELTEGVFDIGLVMETAALTVAAAAARKGVELVCHAGSDVPPVVRGDADRLRQILVNLLSNAVKFTEAGEVVITAELEWEEPEHHWLVFRVRDTGTGIAPEQQAGIFEPFLQAEGRRGGQEGTGLGLAICRQLTHVMGGAIRVESEVGRGSTFVVRLPFHRADEAGGPAPSSSIELRGLRVLVVDDHAATRQTLCDYLRSWGCAPVATTSGYEALRELYGLWGTPPYSVLIADGEAPGVSGTNLAQVVRSHPGLAHVKVVVTGNYEPHAAEQAAASGADGFVAKPVRRSDLFDALATVLGCGAPDPAGHERPVAASAPPRRVLLAEDNPVNQQVAAATLRKRGHTVTVAADGQQALEALDRESFDVVLMDVQMPILDGLEATTLLRADPRHAQLPVIALTAHALEGDRERCLAVGMTDYLTKPFVPDQLLEKVSYWSRTSAFDAAAEPAPAAEVRPADPTEWTRSLLEVADGDTDFAQLLLEELVAHAQSQARLATEALAQGDLDMVGRAAHAIKGGAATLGIKTIRDAARELEQSARDQAAPLAERALGQLVSAIAVMESSVKKSPVCCH